MYSQRLQCNTIGRTYRKVKIPDALHRCNRMKAIGCYPPRAMNSKSQTTELSQDINSLAVAAASALDAAIRESGKSSEDICAATRDRSRCIEHEPKTLTAWRKPADNLNEENPLFRAVVILKCTKNLVPLQWLCGQVGGVFVPDASSYGRLQLLNSVPSEISRFPEMAEWLVQSERMAALKGRIYKLTMNGEAFTKDMFADVVIAWLSAKGWMEGYLEWTGAKGLDLTSPTNPTAASAIVEARHVVKNAFSLYPKGKPHTRTIATCLDLSESSVQKWQQRPNQGNSGSANPFDHLAVLSQATGSLKMIHWLCSEIKGHLRSAKTNITNGIVPWPTVYWELTELDYLVTRALRDDGDVKPQEAEKIRKQWNDLRSWMAALFRSKGAQ